MAIQDEPAERSVRLGGIARLEVDEQSGGVGRGPPVHEHVARPEAEAQPLAGRLEQAGERAERVGERGRRRANSGSPPGQPAVSCRGTTRASRSAAVIRWRVLFVMPARMASSSASAAARGSRCTVHGGAEYIEPC